MNSDILLTVLPHTEKPLSLHALELSDFLPKVILATLFFALL